VSALDGKYWEINLQEAARYLGYTETPDDAVTERLTAAARQVAQAARPRYIYAAWPARSAAAGCELKDALFLPGLSIARHMDGCDEGLLLAATLGAGVDALLRRAALTDVLDSVVMDACATALVEQVTDAAEEEIHRSRAGRDGPVYFTSRFSPGYGDLPLTVQPGIMRLLDAPRRIGLSVTSAYIMVPRKSVTAIVGGAAAPLSSSGRAGCALAGRCSHCAMRERCLYRNKQKKKQG
jgi:hypothetical protein